LSAEKTQDRDGNGPETPPGGQPAALTSLAGALTTRLRFQQRLGLRAYPATSALRRFLAVPDRPGREQAPAAARPPVQAAARPPAGPEDRTGGLDGLRRDLEACTLCGLAATRQGLVCGAGGSSVRLLFVGDWSRQDGSFSPAQVFGAAEDTMLGNMVRAMGLAPAEVYVTNAIKCCPSAGLTPGEESRTLCQAHLRREIDLVRPTIVCAMGEVAARSVLGQDGSLVRLRGRFHPLGGKEGLVSAVQVAVTYHPRLLLDHPDLKKAAWEDLQMVQRRLRGSAQRRG
jgi:DNA polymerase